MAVNFAPFIRRRRRSPSFIPGGAHFDGTNDGMASSSLTTASSQRFLISAFLRVTGGAGTIRYFANTTGTRFYGYAHSSDTYRVGIRNATNTTLAEWRFTTNLTADTDWRHLLVYFDGITPANTFGTLNGVAEGSDTTGAVGTFDTGKTFWAVGATTAINFPWMGDIAEIWMGDPGRTVVASDVDSFLIGGRPRNLGASGERPFGVSPMFYMADDYTNFNVNSGTAGDLNITGALTDITRPVAL